jgi:hypothetical protein
LEGFESFVPVLGVDDILVHLALLLGSSPGNGLEGSADGDRSALANLLGEADGLGEGGAAGERKEALAAVTLVLG